MKLRVTKIHGKTVDNIQSKDKYGELLLATSDGATEHRSITTQKQNGRKGQWDRESDAVQKTGWYYYNHRL